MGENEQLLATIWGTAIRVVRGLMPYGAVRLVQRLRQNRVEYGTLIKPKNINTRVYWNRKLAKVDGFWRDEPYIALAEHLPQDRSFTLLDIGCATGDGLEWLTGQFPRAALSGIDFSSVGIAKAKAKQSSVMYSIMDVSRERLQGDWDYICLVEILEHLTDPYSVLDQAVSRARVAVFVSVPFKPNAPAGPHKCREHVWRFDKHAFDRYGGRVLLRDFLNEGKSPRVLFEVPGQAQSGHSPEESRGRNG